MTHIDPDLVRTDWSVSEIDALFALPFPELLYKAQTVHRRWFDPCKVQLSTLLSIKTGGCPEDCKYCPQSVRYDTGLEAERLMSRDEVIEKARTAKAGGATRFCMGAGWRNPKDRDIEKIIPMVKAVREMGLETCLTLGMLTEAQTKALKDAGLDYYNHNLDTSEDFYGEIITTRTYQDRLDTLERVRRSGMKVCCGGIVGLGESRGDRVGLLHTLATMERHPESVPINMLVKVEGTPMASDEHAGRVDPFEFVRTIAVARILMPKSHVRLSAGREDMDDSLQALCFLAGANSIFYGERLLTTENPDMARDRSLFERLGIEAAQT